MISAEDLFKLVSFSNEPFEVHACLTHALAIQRFAKIRRIILDRIENLYLHVPEGNEPHVISLLEKAPDIYELAVLLHDIGKLLPLYQCSNEIKSFFGHEIFSFYILYEAFRNEDVVKALNVDHNYWSYIVYVPLLPVLLHHSAHRWVFQGEIIRRLKNFITSHNKQALKCAQHYSEALSRVLNRTCLCLGTANEICKVITDKAREIVIDIINKGYNNIVDHVQVMLSELEDVYPLNRDINVSQILEASTPILTALLQLSDRLAAKIVRCGGFEEHDIKALSFLLRKLNTNLQM